MIKYAEQMNKYEMSSEKTTRNGTYASCVQKLFVQIQRPIGMSVSCSTITQREAAILSSAQDSVYK
jgi:hypothetical protein